MYAMLTANAERDALPPIDTEDLYGLSVRDAEDLRFYWREYPSAMGLRSVHGPIVDVLSAFIERGSVARFDSPVEVMIVNRSPVAARGRRIRAALSWLSDHGQTWAVHVLHAMHGESLPGLAVPELGSLSTVARLTETVRRTREALVLVKVEELMALAREQDAARVRRCRQRKAAIPFELEAIDKELQVLGASRGANERRARSRHQRLLLARHRLRRERAELPDQALSGETWARIERGILRDADASITPQVALAALLSNDCPPTPGEPLNRYASRKATHAKARRATVARLRKEAEALAWHASALYGEAARKVLS